MSHSADAFRYYLYATGWRPCYPAHNSVDEWLNTQRPAPLKLDKVGEEIPFEDIPNTSINESK